MKKIKWKYLVLLVFSIILVIILNGCGNPQVITNDGRIIRAVDITNEEELVYDIQTNIVWIRQLTSGGFAIYTLYISENGLPCKFINGQMVEINYSEVANIKEEANTLCQCY